MVARTDKTLTVSQEIPNSCYEALGIVRERGLECGGLKIDTFTASI